MKVRAYDALTDYDKILELVKQEKLTSLYRKDKNLYKEAMSNSETFVLEDNGEILGFARAISDFTYTTYIMELVSRDDSDKEEVFRALLSKLEHLALHGSCNIICDNDIDEEVYLKLGFKKSGNGLKFSYKK